MTAGKLLQYGSVLILMLVVGCATWHTTPALPTRNSQVLDQLVVFSDSPLPQSHRLLEELRTQRTVVSTKLALPISDEPIHIYLFASAKKLDAFMHDHYPALPVRRAFFVETDTRLTVYAYWGDRVAEDLRHEVAHGYLHAVVPHLPLWLDEGLAEFFEVPRGLGGLNRPHLDQLAAESNVGWQPNLERLERLEGTANMTQTDYAESWAWVYFLLESSPPRRQILHDYLHALGRAPAGQPISRQLAQADPAYAQKLLDYLASLRQSLR